MKSMLSFLAVFVLLLISSSQSFAQCPNSLEANAKSMICDNATNKKIYFNTTGGLPPYNYSIDNGSTFSSNNQFDSLANGLYYLVVQDFDGCVSYDTIDIGNLPDASMPVLYSPVSCDSLYTLSVPPCTNCSYVWDFADTSIQNTHQVVDSGWHRVQIIHSNGNCIINYDSVYVFSTIQSASVNDIFGLCGHATDTLRVQALGGQAPFSYAWSTGGTDDFAVISSGVHSVTVSDANGCTATALDTVYHIPNLDSVEISAALDPFQLGHCINAAPTALSINLITGSMPNGGYFSGPGVRNGQLGPNGALFHPDSAVIDLGHTGNATLTYTYQTSSGCWAQTERTTEVHALPDLSFLNLPASICPADDSFQMQMGNHVTTGPYGNINYLDTLSQQTGIFSVTDSSGANIPGFIVLFDTLQPDAAIGYDQIYLQFTYTTDTSLGGCTASSFDTLVIEDCCVWPGDANDDGLANHYDILPIGLHYGANGLSRSNVAIDWDCKRSTNWGTNILGSSNVDIKHVDCDGNGNIHAADTQAIVQNWTLTHAKSSNFGTSSTSTSVDIFVDTATHHPGDTVTLDIVLNSSAIPSMGYGVAFTVTYDTFGVDSGSIAIDFSNSWLGNINSNLIGIYKDFYHQGQVQVGMTRIDQVSANGSGPICQVQFIIKDDVLPKSNTIRIDFEVSDANFIDSVGRPIATTPILGGVMIVDPYMSEHSLESEGDFKVMAYPNPTTGYLNLKSLDANIQQVQISDVTGRFVLSKNNLNRQQTHLDLSALTAGVYFIKVSSEFGSEQHLRIIKK